MTCNVTIIESTRSDFPAALRTGTLIPSVPRLWAMGNLGILQTPLLGLFCSTRCPGNVILRTYDLALALRDAGVAVISGFHTPMEKECLDVFLRGSQPLVVCPARSLQNLRLPAAWRPPLEAGRLLVLSPIGAPQRRPTAALAEQRNRFVATLAPDILLVYATPGGKTARLSAELMAQGKRLFTLDLDDNAHLMAAGVTGMHVTDLGAHFAAPQAQ